MWTPSRLDVRVNGDVVTPARSLADRLAVTMGSAIAFGEGRALGVEFNPEMVLFLMPANLAGGPVLSLAASL